MYSVGEEFERLVEDDMEYLTCIANVNIGAREYLICENENGTKRVFYYDALEEDLELMEEDEADEVLEVWEDEYYGSDKEYMYWNEEFGEYDEIEKENKDFKDIDDTDPEDEDYIGVLGSLDDEDEEEYDEDEEDLDEFLNDFLE